ncbi:hypothetical protein M2352_000622 [Azospirillum fermentarium]|uniref:hypothetical protein n=1 Tax=Azospirillum fermentarium TaxID=1233114 RepID=UPI0022278F04|nr:hypothetical protein [Azospirillum fermentarium]MCW2245031.1 hypothetical protein [Azospirillum fermentarium]
MDRKKDRVSSLNGSFIAKLLADDTDANTMLGYSRKVKIPQPNKGDREYLLTVARAESTYNPQAIVGGPFRSKK